MNHCRSCRVSVRSVNNTISGEIVCPDCMKAYLALRERDPKEAARLVELLVSKQTYGCCGVNRPDANLQNPQT